jgi:hypothetical protein
MLWLVDVAEVADSTCAPGESTYEDPIVPRLLGLCLGKCSTKIVAGYGQH